MCAPPKSNKKNKSKKSKKANIFYNNNNMIINNYISSDNNNFEIFKKQIMESGAINKKTLQNRTASNMNSNMELIQSNNIFLSNLEKKDPKNLENKLNKNDSNQEINDINKNIKKANHIEGDNNYNNKNLKLEQLVKAIKPDERYKYFIDSEMNKLIYFNAIEIDYRTFLQYYWSLLKEKQHIIFTFINNTDYNITSVKIILFICSFSIYFIVNTFFF